MTREVEESSEQESDDEAWEEELLTKGKQLRVLLRIDMASANGLDLSQGTLHPEDEDKDCGARVVFVPPNRILEFVTAWHTRRRGGEGGGEEVLRRSR